MLYIVGANVLAADEEGETCLHLAFARHTATVNLDHADVVQQVFCCTVSITSSYQKFAYKTSNYEKTDAIHRAVTLPSLVYRRYRGDIIEVYKYLHGMYSVRHDSLLQEAPRPAVCSERT